MPKAANITWNLEFKNYLEEQFRQGRSYRSLGLELKTDPVSLKEKIVALGWNKEHDRYWEEKKKRDEEERFEKKLRRYPSSVLPHTRAYLIENLRRNPEFKTYKGIMLKEDFIEQYYKSRKESGKKIFNYDFSMIPSIIKSRKEKVPIFVNEVSTKTGKLVGKWETCYKTFIINQEDNMVCAGMVSKTKTAQYIDTEEFIRRSKERFGEDRFDYSEVNYVNNNTPIKLRCLRCGDWFEQMPTEHLKGTGYCPDCAMELCGIAKRKSTEEFVSELINVFGEDIFDFSETEYIDSQHPVSIRDKSTGIVYTRYPSALLEGLDPRCKDSRGELFIKEWLISNNISYSNEVLHKDIFSENTLGVYIDFITDSGIWIEYNGIQHYKYYKGSFHGISVEVYKKQLRRDKAIKDYCSNNNIQLLVIPYTYYTKERIEEILNRVILKGEKAEDFIKYPKIEEVDYEE